MYKYKLLFSPIFISIILHNLSTLTMADNNNNGTTYIKATNKHNFSYPKEITLHALDNMNIPIAISNHRFFHRPENISPQEVITTLTESLASALEYYPPVAGSIRLSSSNSPYIALDNAGTPFISEIRDTPFVSDGDDLDPRPELLLSTPSPGLAVKLTQFSCGTICVASSLHHWLADLRGFLDFLSVWAKIAKNQTIESNTIPSSWAHTPSTFFNNSSSSIVSSSSSSSSSSSCVPPLGYKVMTGPIEMPHFLPAEAQGWKITESDLTKLKNDLTPQGSDSWISSGDALTALIWGVITRAREIANIPRSGGFGRSSKESGTETIGTAADGRERSPNKTMAGGQYFGNFNLLFVTTVPREDLLATDTQSASKVAMALRNSLNKQLSLEAIENRLKFMEEPENAGKIVWSADIAFTNWCRNDLQGDDMDFGWGKPFNATPGTGMVPGGFSRLIHQRNTKEIHMLISVEKDAAEAMKVDPLLTKYASLVRIY